MTSTQRADGDDLASVEDATRRYYAVVSDLASTEDDLRTILAENLRVVEHPNALVPTGAVRDLTQTLAGFRAGKALLSQQEFHVEDVVAAGERAAVRATWRGTVGVDAGPFRAGQELTAHVAAFVTVRDGLIAEHETYDCYEPFAST